MGSGVLLALDFDRDKILCAFNWVHNDLGPKLGWFFWMDQA